MTTTKSHGPLHFMSVLAGSSYQRLEDGRPAKFVRRDPTLFAVQFDIVSASKSSPCKVSYSSGSCNNGYTVFVTTWISYDSHGRVVFNDHTSESADKEIDAWHLAMAEEYELLSSIVEVPISVRCSL